MTPSSVEQNQKDLMINAPSWTSEVRQDTGSILRKGYLYIFGTLMIFCLWAIFMPLSSAVIANGRIIAAGQNKLLQHPTGGVVSSILAKDGDRLEKGQIVLEIAPEVTKAELARLQARFSLLTAQKARFEAEKAQHLQAQKKATIAKQPPLPRPKPDPNIKPEPAQAIASAPSNPLASSTPVELEQMAEFEARMARFTSELASLNNQYAALQSEYAGLAPQIENQKQLVGLQQAELDKVRPLVKERYISKRRMLEIESGLLGAQSRLNALKAQEGSTQARMEEIQSRIAQLKSSRIEEYSRELTSIHTELSSISEEIKAAEKAVFYTKVRAPVAGILTKLAAHTEGGVLRPGETIGEIVPVQSNFLVEARIAPQDVASVQVGQPAEIVITAFNRRLIDPYPAEVQYVAADSTLDEQTGEPYFSVRLGFDTTNSEQPIQAGMFAESYIQLGSRSFFGYLMKPLADSFQKAFQER